MPRKPTRRHSALVAAGWPFGIALTAFSYLWRITPVSRRELEGAWERDRPPEMREPVDPGEVQRAEDGSGPFLRRRYRAVIRASRTTAADAMAEIAKDPNLVVPNGLARFTKTFGERGAMRVGDEYLIRMPGPWDGPVRVADRTPTSFRFVTLRGHIEAGQIEWRARDEDGRLVFEIESWSRPGDRLSDLMHHRLRIAKEVQLHMWTSVLERVVRRYGRRQGPLDVETRRLAMPS